MRDIKRIQWHGGASAHIQQRSKRSQRDLVEASLMRGRSDRRRWDERSQVEDRTRRGV